MWRILCVSVSSALLLCIRDTCVNNNKLTPSQPPLWQQHALSSPCLLIGLPPRKSLRGIRRGVVTQHLNGCPAWEWVVSGNAPTACLFCLAGQCTGGTRTSTLGATNREKFGVEWPPSRTCHQLFSDAAGTVQIVNVQPSHTTANKAVRTSFWSVNAGSKSVGLFLTKEMNYSTTCR